MLDLHFWQYTLGLVRARLECSTFAKTFSDYWIGFVGRGATVYFFFLDLYQHVHHVYHYLCMHLLQRTHLYFAGRIALYVIVYITVPIGTYLCTGIPYLRTYNFVFGFVPTRASCVPLLEYALVAKYTFVLCRLHCVVCDCVHYRTHTCRLRSGVPVFVKITYGTVHYICRMYW